MHEIHWQSIIDGRALAVVVLVVCIMPMARARAATIEIGPADNFRAVIQGLDPGDTLVLGGGTYTLSSYFAITLQGTSALPIVIRAKADEHPVIEYAGNAQNIVNIVNSRFLTLEGIEFTGGSRGLRFTGGSDITVRNCHMHHTGDNAISANDAGNDYARFQFIHNEIDHTGGTGEAFYLGCNNDGCQFHDSLIANNYIHDLDGSSVSQGDGIEIKQGSYANIVRDNVIHGTRYPGITLYDTHGNGDPNIIERNLVWSSEDNGIQVTADAIVRNNIVLGAAANAIASNTVQGGSASNLTIVNNTLLMASGNGIRLNGVSGAVIVANNAIYAPHGYAIRATGSTGFVSASSNAGQGDPLGVTVGFDNGGNLANDFHAAAFTGAPPQNLMPKGAILVGAANAAYLPSEDYGARNRDIQADIGAYRANTNGNPGWPLQAGFKVLDAILANGFDPLP